MAWCIRPRTSISIVGSGPNSCILHYSQKQSEDDIGRHRRHRFCSEYKYYQSDITRTFPVSGKFSEIKPRVIVRCWRLKKRALEKVRPGVSFCGSGAAARRCLLDPAMPNTLRTLFATTWACRLTMSECRENTGAGIRKSPSSPGVYLPDKVWAFALRTPFSLPRTAMKSSQKPYQRKSSK